MVYIRKDVNISKVAKLYYVILAFADWMVCMKNFLWDVLCDTLWILTDGKYSFCIDTLSNVSCIVMNLWYYFSENISVYTLASLSIERLIAVSFPLKAKLILDLKFTLSVLSILIGPQCLYYLVAIPLVSKVVSPFPRVNGALCFLATGTLLGDITGIINIVYLATIHVIINLIATLVVIMKLKAMRNQRSELQGPASSQSKRAIKEKQTTMTMLGVAITNLFLYGTYFLARFAVLGSKLFPKLDGVFLKFLNQFLLFAVLNTIIPHFTNIFIYLILLPAFRRAALCHPITAKYSSSQGRQTDTS